MPSVFSQFDSKMHGGGEAACHGNVPQLGTRLRTAPSQRVCDVLRKHRKHHVKAGVPKAHRRKGNGWFVVEKEGAEINTESFYCASDKMEQDASQ